MTAVATTAYQRICSTAVLVSRTLRLPQKTVGAIEQETPSAVPRALTEADMSPSLRTGVPTRHDVAKTLARGGRPHERPVTPGATPIELMAVAAIAH